MLPTRLMLLALVAAATPAPGQRVARVDAEPAGLSRLPERIEGRVVAQPDGTVLRQWPGTYVEAAFTGPAAYVRVGPGKVALRISVDGGAPVPLVQPVPGLYGVTGLGDGPHRLRIDVASESQDAPTAFGGIFAPAGTRSAPLPRRTRAIEFIGDSHTVGYANTSDARECTQDQVWASTNTSRGVAPLTAGRYDADYRVNAISGRGVVRNYNGFASPSLPQAYPHALFGQDRPADDRGWRPQVIVIALGTNDFSTALNPGERWPNRDALHADYEESYVRFVQQLRRSHPQAHFVLWGTDLGGDEVLTEVARVTARLRAAGETRVGFVPMRGLSFRACHAHPDLADDRRIADALAAYIDAHPAIWTASTRRPRR